MKKEIALTLAHRVLAPHPVCLLTSRYRGQVNVMALAWVGPISLRPPLVGMAIHPACHTHDLLVRSQECVLNIPGRPLAEQVVRCGNLSGGQADKIELTGLTLESAQRVEAPWIDECLAHVECAIVDKIMPGDHSLFIAEIVGAWVEEEAFTTCWLTFKSEGEDNDELQILQHLGGARFALLGNAFDVT